MGCFIYCVLGTSKDITLGPTAIMSLMVAEFGAAHGDPTIAIVLALGSGVIQVVMGLLNIGTVLLITPFNKFHIVSCA
jgi:sodium-independent sulfate anion transporter 11